ncbi:allergen Tha p 1-like isoform X2 [Venturia canescens]|uniref:allergen Tha p 1-like isoform X2 n=1 Tax=Venturia canescens TaxID=32260 RepID=UPI001C9D2C7F|nr:allergen Tha p 1-like isoform X2 [Venturia canescens]
MVCRSNGFSLLVRSSFLVILLLGIPKYSRGYLWAKPNTYTSRWDKVNLDEILDSKRLLHHYFKCLMSKGPCPPDGAELKRIPDRNTYTTRWDKINVDEIIQNKRLLHHYFKCLMSQGPCPPDGAELKRVLPEALATGCSKCTKSQIEGSVKVIRYLREFEAEKFDILANKYDPEGIYRRRYLQPPPDDNTA